MLHIFDVIRTSNSNISFPSFQSLTEVKMELKRCAQNKQQLERQVGKLTAEKDKLQTLVQDAKSALKRAAG